MLTETARRTVVTIVSQSSVAFPHAHILLRALGGFGLAVASPVDRWSTGWRFGVPGGDAPHNPAGLVTFAAAAFNAIATFHASPTAFVGTNCSFLEVTAARIGPDGKYLPLVQDTTHYAGDPIFGGGTPNKPYDAALVFSLRTALPRGRGSNGRSYYPAIAAPIEPGTGRVLPASIGQRLALFQTLVRALNTAANVYAPGMALQVISSVGSVANPVTSIRSDGRLDRIERRDNGLPSVYQSLPI